MVMHAECVLYTVSNSQSVNNRHANKQIVKGLVHLKIKLAHVLLTLKGD